MRLYNSKHSLHHYSKKIKNDISLILYNTATLRMAGALEKSSEVMKYMQQLVKVPEIQATMQELSKEMMKVCTVCSLQVHHCMYLLYCTSQTHSRISHQVKGRK